MQNRLTKQSVVNLQAAAAAELIPADGGGYMVRLAGAGGRSAYLHGSASIAIYETPTLARRAIRRLRPGLPISIAAMLGEDELTLRLSSAARLRELVTQLEQGHPVAEIGPQLRDLARELGTI
jgi:hypothetical protein